MKVHLDKDVAEDLIGLKLRNVHEHINKIFRGCRKVSKLINRL